ncbi:hypothetical protein BA896_002950 [Janthinobacterium lividum]|uniref:Uncharacterized protein n=1 Tax=Janthinobacterium lividum TaxID=29581 RepID=A0A1E8PP62_9BURK|nr:hypothetical protein BA896_002950 [Janthinobacterium lividum]
MMNNKLQYKFTPEFFVGDGVDFVHEWKHDQLDYRSKEETLKEMVAWCFENWNIDPNWNHEWQFTSTSDVVHSYNHESGSWQTVEFNHRFYLGTDDDAWAALFKLMWSNFIE